MELSAQQKIAVEHIGSPALVVAGAGSGKTRTLTSKIAYLVSNGYEPERILAITFTNKAANEMKTRVAKVTGISIKRFPWVQTYHAACFTILKRHCGELGYKLPLRVINQNHQKNIIKDVLEKSNVDKDFNRMAVKSISNAKNFGDPLKYFDLNQSQYYLPIQDIYDLYEKELKNMNAVDFDNILVMTRNILRDNEDIRKYYSEFFQYILFDEYQDTNNLNEEITSLLIQNGNFFAVGDDWQAIYSFRMSSVDHFINFKSKYPNGKIFRLEENYRSSDIIVQIGNELIGHNKNRVEKRCFSKKSGGVVELKIFGNDTDEAEWVVQQIISHNTSVGAFDDMAVLYRINKCSFKFEQVFRVNNIHYKILGGKGFFERKEVIDLLSYLSASVYDDNISFERIINIPKRGLGSSVINRIKKLKQDDISIKQAAWVLIYNNELTPKKYDSLNNLLQFLDEIKVMTPEDALNEILFKLGYMDYLEKYCKSSHIELEKKEDSIKQLIQMALEKTNIKDYLNDISISSNNNYEGKDSQKGVTLSTIHSVKGLEFSLVFIVGCEEMILPHRESIKKDEKIQEERRIMYVAITRASKHLYICSSNERTGCFGMPSRFYYEIQEALNKINNDLSYQ